MQAGAIVPRLRVVGLVCGDRHRPMVHRSDDQEATIRQRLAAFEAQTSPLVQRYGSVIARVDGNQAPEVVLKAAAAVARAHGVT